MKRLLRGFAWVLGSVLVLVVLLVGGIWVAVERNASDSQWPRAGGVTREALPGASIQSRTSSRRAAAQAVGVERTGQILFGDLHVHTGYSADALTQSLPLLRGEGSRTPADACDFARFCSALDFWSINDHAESISTSEWEETIAAIRKCNEVAGDPADPDLVSFLGWEWSQGALEPEGHFGHKNIVLRDTAADAIPSRPIGAGRLGGAVWGLAGLAVSLRDAGRWGLYEDLHRSLLDDFGRAQCPPGVDVRELPPDCYERAPTPDVLFEKLDQWGFPALVIPHGLAWGTTNPEGADLARQLSGIHHDPDRQRLIEVYSGHGNSEVWSDLRRAHIGPETEVICPEPTEDFEPCCWRAGEIVRARCTDPRSGECQYQVDAARLRGAQLGSRQNPTGAVLGSRIEDFGDCGQLRGAFLPAFNYRPGGSAQYGLALGGFEEEAPVQRFRLGFIGSSDNHRARAGSGYKEFGRTAMTDGTAVWGDFRDTRNLSYYYTGGLVAVHAKGRDRDSIFDALDRREVYATSGDRILLWFDLLSADGGRVPMGSEVSVDGVPRFEVRAVGSLEQLPGCPDEVLRRVGSQRLEDLCLGECHNPGTVRRRITRIEVVRIRPQQSPEEEAGQLIEDPWLVLPCGADPEGCRVVFEDPDFVRDGRETVYYVRALQEPTPAVNGDPLQCERDDSGACVKARLCPGGDQAVPPEDCPADVEERAWSSPIFVDPAGVVRRTISSTTASSAATR